MIQHAEELLKLYNDDRAARAAIEEIPDENWKAFLKIELNLKWYLSKKLFRTLNNYVMYSTDDQFFSFGEIKQKKFPRTLGINYAFLPFYSF